MNFDKYVVILSSKSGGKNHLKMDVERGGKRVSFTLGKGVKSDDAYMVLFGNEITKQALYKDKNEYKVRFQANNQIDVMLVDGAEVYIGSTGRTPSFEQLNERLLSFEREQNDKAKRHEKDDDDIAKCEEEKEGENTLAGNAESTVNGNAENEDNNRFEQGNEKPSDFIGVEGTLDTKTVDGTDASYDTQNDDDKDGEHCHSMDALNVLEDVKTAQNAEVKTAGDNGVDVQKSRDVNGFSFDKVHFDGSNFYLSVKPQIDEIFVCFPEAEELNDAVPNSRWVQVEAVDGFYVVGLVYDLDAVSYICYGVPSKEGNLPPDEIKNLCVWLPISCEKGYWVIYQDALTGKCLK